MFGDSLGSTYGKVLGTILGNVDEITLRIDFGRELGSLDVSFGNIHWLIWCTKLVDYIKFLCQILI